MKSFKNISIICFAILLLTCSKDGNNDNEEPVKKNVAPSAFNLTTVANEATEVSLLPSFTWQKANDADGDEVTYDFYLDTNNQPTTKLGSNLTTTSYTPPSELDANTQYYWFVTAKDSEGNSTSSSIFSFTTITNDVNNAPAAFNLLTLENESENSTITPSFTWEAAIDPEGDTVTYDFYLDTAANPETKSGDGLSETNYTITSSLLYNTTYYWKVIATDTNNNSVESDTFSFSTIMNPPPSSFNLSQIENGATAVSLLPTFNWEEALDDGVVTYNLYLSLDENPELFESDITDTTFDITTKLFLNQTYYWKVVAKDANGNETESEIFSFTTQGLNLSATPKTSSAAFSPRAGHTSVVFDNKIWVIGGYDGTNYYNDVWSSSDGINWTEATSNAPFHARWKHASVVYDNKIWVIAGQSDDPTDTLVDLRFSDVWYSSNGVDWTMATDGPFDERYAHTLTVYDNKMWITGGYPTNGDTDNIWQSTNGITWTLVNDNVPYGIDLRGHNVFEFKNELWIANTYEDIWKTNNGVSWSLELEDSSFLKRIYASVETFDENLIYFGGESTNAGLNLYSDIWYSIDGKNWSQGVEQGSFLERYLHTSVVFNEMIFIIGGQNTAGYLNDVWALD